MIIRKSNKIAVKDLKAYLTKNYKFSSGIAITFDVKVGKALSVSTLKKARGM